MRRISASSSTANAGEPRASTTSTPSRVTKNAALEMKLRLALVPRADTPCTM